MPKHIAINDMERMFPFEFYEELSQKLQTHELVHPAFNRKSRDKMPIEQRQQMFAQKYKQMEQKTLNAQNIMSVEPFGELLLLDICQDISLSEKAANETEKSQIPLALLMCQYYDSSEQPVFSESVTAESIAQIPEILWDDPNLLLAILTFQQDETIMAVLKIPDYIEKNMSEPAENE